MVEASWSFERVMQDHNRALIEGQPEGPDLPLYQWHALQRLERLKDEFAETGDGFVILAGVRICANHDLIMPEWLSRAFIKQYDKVLTVQVGSWDDAFGRPLPKGKHLTATRKRREMPVRVWMTARQMESEGWSSHNTEFFDELGRRCGVNRSDAQEYYVTGRSIFSPAWSESVPEKF